MESNEPVQPPVTEQVYEVLQNEGPLSHEEIMKETSMEDSKIQQALNELWREDVVYHTIDRRFDTKNDSHSP